MKNSDFNDLALLEGPEAVQKAIESVQSNAAMPEREWPDPRPIEAPLKPVPPFDASSLLPSPLREWVQDEAERMSCPEDFVAVPCLVALGSLIGAGCVLQPKRRDNWVIAPNLWGAIVAPPSAKKTPAMSRAFSFLNDLARKEHEKHKEAQEGYEIEKIKYEARCKGIKNRLEGLAKKEANPDNAEQKQAGLELTQAMQAKPQEPQSRRFKTNDATVEKLGELLQSNPHGLLVERDELAGLLSTWEREDRASDRAFFLESWDGIRSFDTDRIGRGSIHIPNLCLSLCGGIQPDKLLLHLHQAEHGLGNDGLLQRFQLLVYPDLKSWEYVDREPNGLVQSQMKELFATLVDLDPFAWGAVSAPDVSRFPIFRFDDSAQGYAIEWLTTSQKTKLPQEERPLLQQHFAKYDKLFFALALIFHLVECISTKKKGLVGLSSVTKAAAWCEYLEAHARRCYGLLCDQGLRAARSLADKIKQGKLVDGFTARDVRRHEWRYLAEDKLIADALEWLEDNDWVRSQREPTVGRPTIRYLINPKAINWSAS